MNRQAGILLGGIGTIGLIVLALWGWHRADAIVAGVGWEKRSIGVWAVRCAAIALISGAEALLLTAVVERVYRPDAVCALARLSALFVLMLSAVSAIALGLAGR
jgi:hypothetical protein